MSDLYLRFTDEAQATKYLYTQVPTEYDEEGEPIAWYSQPNFANIDVIGIIYENQPIPDPENPPEPVPMEGWHVNVRLIGEDGSALEPFKVEPEHPRRVWG